MFSDTSAPRYSVEVITTRVSCEVAEIKERLCNEELASCYVRSLVGAQDDLDGELFGFLALDSRHRLLGHKILYRGTETQAPVSLRQVFRDALAMNANAIILFHTHPSGDVHPSSDDIALTRRTVEGGELIGVAVHDHFIISPATLKCRSIRSTRPETFTTAGGIS